MPITAATAWDEAWLPVTQGRRGRACGHTPACNHTDEAKAALDLVVRDGAAQRMRRNLVNPKLRR